MQLPLKSLRIGAAQPTALVALFHGLGGNVDSLKPQVQVWSEALPLTAFLCLEAPGNDWFVYSRKREPGEDDGAYVEAVVLPSVRAAMATVNETLDTALAADSLGSDRLVLCGFSQGAAVSAYTSLARGCLGALPFGGPCPPRAALLPDVSTTRICVVTGEKDPYAPHEQIASAFAKYPKVDAQTDGVHVLPNMAHVVRDEHTAMGLAFLKSCGLS